MPVGAPKGNRNHVIHGMRNTRLYTIWRSMRGRCGRPSDGSYHKYGARGIKVCAEWEDFPTFMKWALSNGYNDTLTIDRINGSLGYFPENCRWATYLEQANNRRGNHIISYAGEPDVSMAEFCRKHDLNYKRFGKAIRRGMTVGQAMEKAKCLSG